VRGRALGALECALGGACVVSPAPLLALALAATYAVFALYLVYLRRTSPDAACGCFGVEERPVGRAHVVLDVLASAVAALGAVYEPVGLAAFASAHPLAVVPFAVGAAATVYVFSVGLTVAPELLREVRA
jgi:hypothetical protein